MMLKNVVLVPIGSYGDVYPFVGLGLAMQKRGHRVTVITNEHFRPLMERAGLKFAACGDEAFYQRAIANPDLWTSKGLQVAMGYTMQMQRELYEKLMGVCEQEEGGMGEAVVVAHCLGFAARVAQEKHGLKVATVHLAPASIRTCYEVPRLQTVVDVNRWPMWSKRLMWWMLDKWVVDGLICPMLNQWRGELGLGKVERVLAGWWNSPLLTLGMFGSWFGPMQPDWPESMRVTGFGLYDEGERGEVDEKVAGFLDGGMPPVVFTPGSAMRHARGFFEAAVGACERLKVRGLLLTRHREQLPAKLPATVMHAEFVPLGRILGRCKAMVHHGGIGTCAQGLAAGVPQVVTPFSHDQPDNVARLKRLGVGCEVMPKRCSAKMLAEVLQEMMGSVKVKESCKQVAEQMRKENGLDAACDVIEQVMGR